LPRIAQRLASIFTTNILTTSKGKFNEVDASTIVDNLLKNTNIDSYTAWNMNNDSIDEAIYRVWDEMYLNKYYAAIDGLTGSQTKWQAYTLFKQMNPTPTTSQIIEQVKKMYGNKFSEDSLKEALEGKPVLNIDKYQEYGQTTLEQKYDDVWNIRTWAGSKADKTKLRNEFIKLGGNIDMLDGMYNIAGGVDAFRYNTDFKDETKVTTFLDTLMQASNNIGIQPLTGSKLAVAVNAERQNEKLKQMMTLEFGDTWEDIVYPYMSLKYSEQKLAPQSTRDMTEFYYDLRDQFAEKYPDWALYYTSENFSSSVDTTKIDATIQSLANQSGYTTSKIDKLPTWAQNLSSELSPLLLSDIYKIISGSQSSIDMVTITYLQQIKKSYPQYASAIQDFIDRYK
jgi:hypothetical protein